MFKKKTITFLASFLAGRLIKWAGEKDLKFKDVVNFVRTAEEEKESGAEKREYVKSTVKALAPRAKSFLLNSLIELALIYAVRKGLVRK